MWALPPLGKRGIYSEDNTTGLRIQLSQSLTLSELWGFPGGTNSKSAMQIAIRSLVEEDPQGKGMAIHCSVLAWEISWTEETGRLHCPWGCKESDTTEQLKSSKGPLFTPLYG